MNNTMTENSGYVPRKCSFTKQVLVAKDHSSIQISIASLDKKGIYCGKYEVFALCGKIRKQGISDRAINYLVEQLDS
jgi:small subunit ribosomal protein S21e